MTDVSDYISKVAEEAEKDLPATREVWVLTKQLKAANQVVLIGIHPDLESAKVQAQARFDTHELTWSVNASEAPTELTSWLIGKGVEFRYVIIQSVEYPKDQFKKMEKD